MAVYLGVVSLSCLNQYCFVYNLINPANPFCDFAANYTKH